MTSGSDSRAVATSISGSPQGEWTDLTVENCRPEADGYFLSCTATSMIDAIEDVERRLDKPVVNSNQAVLWAALRRLEITETIVGLGRLFSARRPPEGPNCRIDDQHTAHHRRDRRRDRRPHRGRRATAEATFAGPV